MPRGIGKPTGQSVGDQLTTYGTRPYQITTEGSSKAALTAFGCCAVLSHEEKVAKEGYCEV